MLEPIGGVGIDGSVCIAEDQVSQVRRVGPDGMLRAFAGIGDVCGTSKSGGDGGPATQAHFDCMRDIAVGKDGSVYIADQNGVVRQVDSSGVVRTVAGNRNDPCTNYPFSCQWLQNRPATALGGALNVQSLATDAEGNLFIGNASYSGYIRKVKAALPHYSFTTLPVASADGTELYLFDASGKHQQTIDTLSNTTRYLFAYDPAGRLASVTDVDGNQSVIERDASGAPTAIVGPYGQRTVVTLDSNGYLATIANPSSETNSFTYDPGGLMQTMTDARGGLHRFGFDALGRLISDEDPATSNKTLSRTEGTSGGFTVDFTTGLGRKTTHVSQYPLTGGYSRTTTTPDGLSSTLQIGADETSILTSPDGMSTTTAKSPDPRFGMFSPLLTTTRKTPAGLTQTQAASMAITLSNPADLLSVTSLTRQTTQNSATWTATYTASNRTWTTTSPAGRKSYITLDSAGRTVSSQVDSLLATAFGYDARGRLSGVTQGTRSQTIGYGPDGLPNTLTDALSQSTSLVRDAVGRIRTQTLADGTATGFTYDADSNLTSVAPPARAAHGMSYTPVDLLGSYDPPVVDGATNVSTMFAYDLDRMLRTTTRPDGIVVSRTPDAAGRIRTVSMPTGTITYTYSPTTGKLTGIAGPDGETVTFGYDGNLRTDVAYSGVVAGSVHWTYSSDFRVSQETVNGGLAASFGYDADGLLTVAGSLGPTPSPAHGLLMGTTLGSAADTFGYDTFGALASHGAAYGTTSLFSENATLRDALGRIKTKSETVQGSVHTYEYGYDVPGRLRDVAIDGMLAAHYEYDANGNRLARKAGGATVSGVYDAQDRLTSYGAATYAYGLNGELASKILGTDTTAYTYDALGNLKRVVLPATGGGATTTIDYIVDGMGRRIGKIVGGELVKGWLWSDSLRIVAETDGAGSVVSRFVYGTRVNAPEYMVRGSDVYRLLTDHLGSVRLVVNVATGAVAQRLDYDEFGVVTSDSNPGFQPFGFAGGLYDADTRLVRFGKRDYDAEIGRWASKDPILFDGGQSNLYEYVLGDPINGLDVAGTQAMPMPIPIGPAVGVVGTMVCMATPSCQMMIKKAIKKVVETVDNICKAGPDVAPPEPPDCAEAAEECFARCGDLLGENYRGPKGKHPGGGTNTQFKFTECYSPCMREKGC